MAQAGPVNKQGSCARGGGSLKARSGQRHWRLRLGFRQGSGGSTPAVAETAVAFVGKLRERRQCELGTSGLRWEGRM